MVEVPEEDRGWWVANDNGRWLVNVDLKRVDNGPNSKMGRQWARADNEPNFKRGRRWAGLTMSQTSKGADDGPGLTWAKNKNENEPTWAVIRSAHRT
jgi:hypothetical protein